MDLILVHAGVGQSRPGAAFMTSIVDYRPASASDVPAIAGLHADSWRRNYRGAFADSFLDGHVLDDRLSVWGQRLAQPGPGQSTVVAEDDGVVVGFAHTVFDDHPTWGALLDNLHVADTVKRRGVGRALMARTASSVLARTQPTGLYLWVLEQNTAAQAFYGSLGGTDVERGFGRPPGGGRPPRIRYAWPDPAILLI
jgi:ribosomal protein S18 acetylase RimI-like enzyme